MPCCGYRWADETAVRTVCIPYILGDEDGSLTSAIIAAFNQAHARVVKGEGQYRLEVKILSDSQETIGYRIDRQKVNHKNQKNILADEGRRKLAVEIALFEQGTEKPFLGPERICAEVDYDYVDGDSYKDLTFVDAHGITQTVLQFSLGQLESIEASQEAANRPLYQRIAHSIVDIISEHWYTNR